MPHNIVTRKRSQVNSDEKFSILIPTWNNLAYLQLCIRSIRENSHFKHQIIVHVNAGVDGSLEWIRQQPDIDFSYTEHNAGICYALNIGRSLVNTDYIVYINDDMYVCPGWDLELFREVEAIGHDRFFLSATVIEPAATSNCVVEKNYGMGVEDFREQELLDNFLSFEKPDWQGATWPPNIVHRDTWDLVGGYSPEFSPGMYSDPDFSMKLWIAGVRFFKGVSRSRVYHFGSKSTQRVKRNRGYYTFISKWGMTSSTVTKKYLRRGQPFNGSLPDPETTPWLELKNLWKRLWTSLRGRSYSC